MNKISSIRFVFELRSRLLRCTLVFGLILITLLPFANFLYHFLAKPLLAQLPTQSHLIVTALPAAFFIPLKFTLLFSFALVIPFVLYQLWAFIAPALYFKERRWVWFLLLASIGLFYLGMFFAYAVVFPLLFNFFVHTTPADVMLFPDISHYLTLVSQLFFAFGFAFEVPVVMIVLVVTGIISRTNLQQLRRYFILFAFVIAMFITPPDVVSQSLLAVPLCLLFEFGLVCTRFVPVYLAKEPMLSVKKNATTPVVSEIKTLLLADDDPISSRMLQSYLQEAGYNTVVVANGGAAWDLLQQDPKQFAMVIVDRIMPLLHGVDLVRKMRKDVLLQKIPVIMLTGVAEKEEVTEAIQAGVLDFLYKPVDKQLLLSVVKKFIFRSI